MEYNKTYPDSVEEAFENLFAEAEDNLEYWIEGAKNEFTEKLTIRMAELEITKSDLARRLNRSPAFITKLLGGSNNFTIETMVTISRELGCNLRCHLEPTNCETSWVDVVKTTSSLTHTHEKPSITSKDYLTGTRVNITSPDSIIIIEDEDLPSAA